VRVTTESHLTVRPLGPDDAAFAVGAVAAVQPHHPWHKEELLVDWRTSERMGPCRRLRIDQDGRPAGWVSATMRHAAPKDAGRISVMLPGTGRDELDRAWEIAEGAARELGIRLAQANIWEDDARTLTVLAQRGWERRRRERFWRLELAGQRDRLVELRDAARRRVEAAGPRVTTAAELGGEAIYPDLHRLDEAASEDIPRDVPRVPVPYDVWFEWMRPPGIVPERLWVATSADRPVGLSFLDYRSTPVTTGFTGVLREHRGTGIARALKLETLVQAIDLAVDAVETDNDSQNAPILHLNEELGYREIPGMLQLRKRLPSA
jgi:GNAT superfamily N-acetyltransferase